MPSVRTVTIPAAERHEGFHKQRVHLAWRCPTCGGPRGEPGPAFSFDGSRRLNVDGWKNPCGHVDKYADLREEATRNGLNAAVTHRASTLPSEGTTRAA